MSRVTRTSVAAAAATALVVPAVVMAGSAGSAASGGSEAGIKAVRAWTDRYQSPSAAVLDGFTATDHCVPGMGYHYVNYERFDDRLEPSRPEVLLYATDDRGNRVLAGAEWVVVDDDQDLSTDHDRPSVFGHELEGPMEGHEPGMPRHYDLHAYAWWSNPSGSFATVNPTISCP